jgi:serine protease AprX
LSATVTPEVLEALENRPDLVVGVTLDGAVRVLHDAIDGDYYSDSTFEYTVGADESHAAGVDGAGVGVAMIDTGVNEVADLEGRVAHGIDLSGEDDGVDRFGHGTFVAGVIAGDGAASNGVYDGVAPAAHLISIKIAGEDGSSDVSQLLAALQWAVSFKDTYDIEVLNLAGCTDPEAANYKAYYVKHVAGSCAY